VKPLGIEQRIPGDWHDGVIPANVLLEDGAFIESSQMFQHYRSRLPKGLHLAQGAGCYEGTMFDLGPEAEVRVGRYSMLNGAWLGVDGSIVIGDYVLISWNVIIQDSLRFAMDPAARRMQLEESSRSRQRDVVPIAPVQPVTIGDKVWIGFDVCILPGVTIGEAAVVGAKSVVTADLPPYCIAAGNPARVIRSYK
jgi:acetyltransferase-like isoleucine patch superfamily enzyme